MSFSGVYKGEEIVLEAIQWRGIAHEEILMKSQSR